LDLRDMLVEDGKSLLPLSPEIFILPVSPVLATLRAAAIFQPTALLPSFLTAIALVQFVGHHPRRTTTAAARPRGGTRL